MLCAGDGSLAHITKQLVEAVALPEDFNYTRDIQSPAVQQYYSVLQALALNQAEGEWDADRDDTMRPDAEMLAKAEEAGVLAEFKAAVGISDDMQHTAPKVRFNATDGVLSSLNLAIGCALVVKLHL
jgi:hypothetical protein